MRKYIILFLTAGVLGMNFFGSTLFAFPGEEFLPYANTLVSSNIISSKDKSSEYRLTDYISRAEAVKMSLNIAKIRPDGCSGKKFSDVSLNTGDLCSYIEKAAEVGIISRANPEFRPQTPITRAELTKILFSARAILPSKGSFGFSDVPDSLGNTAGYINAGVELGCIKQAKFFRPNDPALRGEAFKIVTCALVLSNEEIRIHNNQHITRENNLVSPIASDTSLSFFSAPTLESDGIYPSVVYTPSVVYMGANNDILPDNGNPNGNTNIQGSQTIGGNLATQGNVNISGNLSVSGASNLGTLSATTAVIASLNTPHAISASGNILTSNVGGSIGTGAIITSNSLIISGASLISNINGVTTTTFLTGMLNNWYSVANGLPAISNTEDIYQMGNVGIGTSTPGAPLHVLSNASGASAIFGVGNGNPGLAFGWANNTIYNRIRSAGGDNGDLILELLNPSTHRFYVNSAFTTFYGANLATIGGNVGIGTATPGQKLTITGGTIQLVNGSQGLGKILTSDANGVASWQSPLGSLSGTFWVLGGNPVTSQQNIGTTSNFSLPFITNNIERMRLGNNGNLGIGTITPGAKLDINSGTGGLSGFRISQMNGANTLLAFSTATGSVTRAVGVGLNGDVYITNALGSFDSRTLNYTPTDRPAGLYVDFKNNSANGLNDGGTYNGVLTFRSYGFGSDLSGGNPLQLGYTSNGNLWTRMGTSTTTWGNWTKLLNDSSGWSTLGNTGTTAANFIGTIDDKILTFKTNNVTRMTLAGGTAASGSVLNLGLANSRFDLSGAGSYGAIGQAANINNGIWALNNISTNAGYVHRYGINNALTRTENSDLSAVGTINTFGLTQSTNYTMTPLHQTGVLDIRGASFSTSMNVTRSGAAATAYGIVNGLTGVNDFNNIIGYSSTVLSNGGSSTQMGGIYGIAQTTYHNGTGALGSMYGASIRSYNNNASGSIGAIYGVNIDTTNPNGKGAVGTNYGINISTSNATTNQRALSWVSYNNDPAMTVRAATIDGIYGNSYTATPGVTANTVRSNYGIAYVSTGSALSVKGAEYEGRDGINQTIGVFGYARAQLMATGSYLAGGYFNTDMLYTPVTPTITLQNAYGIYGATSNSRTSASGTIVNQYGAYLSASANAKSTNAYGIFTDTTGIAQNNYGIRVNSVANATGTGAEGLTNNWGIYVNSATKNYFSGRVGIGTTTPQRALDVSGDIQSSLSISSPMVNATGSTGYLAANSRKVLTMPSNNPERGPWNPFWNALGSNKGLFQDEDFANGFNGVNLYNNIGGSTGVLLTREVGIQGTPNSTLNRLKISYDGSGATSPGLGGFVSLFTSNGYNKTYVQRFRALVPVGYTLVLAENSQGSNNTSYWLTDVQGTGKWEDYIRISHIGNTGSLSSGGHVYLSGPVGVPVTWYVASINVYEMNTSQYMANNTWQGVQTFASGTSFAGTGTWTLTGGVGIGTTSPATKLQVIGDIRVGTTGTNGCIQGFGGATIAGTCSSDERLKTDILGIGNVLDKFLNVDTVKYRWNQTAAQAYQNDTGSTQIGYLAQNIETLFPELVSTNLEGYKQVNYSAMNIYTSQAVKELAIKYKDINDKTDTIANTLSAHEVTLSGIELSLDEIKKNIPSQTLIQNTYTTIIQTGSADTGSPQVVNNYYSQEFELTDTGASGMTELNVIQNDSPKSALEYITEKITQLFRVIREIVTLEITAIRGYFHEIFVDNLTAKNITTEKLCFSHAGGKKTCLSKNEIDNLLQYSNKEAQSSSINVPLQSNSQSEIQQIDTNTGSSSAIGENTTFVSTDSGSMGLIETPLVTSSAETPTEIQGDQTLLEPEVKEAVGSGSVL